MGPMRRSPLVALALAAAAVAVPTSSAAAAACPGATACPYVGQSQFGGNGGGVLRFPQAVSVQPDGGVAVGDQGSHTVQVFGPDGALQRTVGTPGTRPGELTSVGAITTAPDGSMWVADGATSRIIRYTGDGKYLLEWGAPGDGPGQFRLGGGRANEAGAGGGLAQGGGYVFVADSGNDRIQRFSQTGGDATVIVPPGTVANPKGLAVAGDRLFISDDQNHRILVTDFAGHQITSIGKGFGTAPGQLNFPYGVALDRSGRVFVADDLNHRVVRYSTAPSYPYKARWGSYGTAPGNLAYPRGLAVNQAGQVLVANTGNDRVEVFDNAGGLLGALGTSGRGPTNLNSPQGVAVDPSGLVGVTDANNGRVVLLNPDNSVATIWGSPNPGPTILKRPVAVAFDGAGNGYVLDQRTAKIQVFDRMTAKAARSIGRQGSGPGALLDPSALTLLPDGSIWVADTGNGRIARFALDGTYLGAITGTGDVRGLVSAPDGSRVYAVGGTKGRVTVYGPDGTRQSDFGGLGRKPGKLGANPGQLSVDAAGNVWVADRANHRVEQFTPDGKFLTLFGERGTAPGQFLLPASVAPSCDGTLAVSDEDNNRLQRFALAAPAAVGCAALPAPAPPPVLQYPTLPAPDGPEVSLRIQRKTGLLRTRTLPLRAGCDTSCTFRVSVVLSERVAPTTGKAPVKGARPRKPVSVSLAPVEVQLVAGPTKQLRVPIGATAVRALRKGLGRRTGLTASIAVTATASVGEPTQISETFNASA